MKAFKKTAFLAIALSAAVAGLAGCKSNAKMPVTFVAVTSSTYNAEVTLGEINYKFQGKFVQNSNKFVLDAIAQGKKSSGGQGGGPGGFGGGFPGGGPGGNSSGPGFEGFGMDEGGEQQGGEQPGGEQPGGEFPGGGFPGGGEQPGANPTDPGTGEQPGQGEQPGGNQGGMPDFGGGENQGGENQGGMPDFGGGENQGGENQDGMPDFGGGEQQGGGQQGGFPGGNQEEQTSEEPEVDTTDYSQFNFTINATYVEEKGYGYAITFTEPDNSTTTVHTDFDKIEGRHSFYYNVKHEADSAVVHFQAKDPTFKNRLADDYKKWDERDSQYIFYAKATGNNNSVATAYMYLHKTNADVVLNTPSGADRSLSFGMKWEEKDGEILIHDGDETIKADKTLPNAEHQGYRIVYNSNTYYCSLNPEVKWKKLTIADFEGQNTHEFVGSYTTQGPDGGEKTVNLNLVEDGKAKLYVGSSTASFVGTWQKDAANKLTIVLDGKTGEFEPGEDGKYSIIVRLSVSSFFGSSVQTVIFTQAK